MERVRASRSYRTRLLDPGSKAPLPQPPNHQPNRHAHPHVLSFFWGRRNRALPIPRHPRLPHLPSRLSLPVLHSPPWTQLLLCAPRIAPSPAAPEARPSAPIHSFAFLPPFRPSKLAGAQLLRRSALYICALVCAAHLNECASWASVRSGNRAVRDPCGGCLEGGRGSGQRAAGGDSRYRLQRARERPEGGWC